MAKVNAARGGQYPLVATFVLNSGDTVVNTSGATVRGDATGVYDAILLPAGATVIGGELVVNTVFNDTTTPTVAVGDSGSAARYLAATSIEAAARTALTLTGFDGSGENIRITVAAGTGDSTSGKFTLRVTYVMAGRQNESQTA